jgi:hypothetical protein
MSEPTEFKRVVKRIGAPSMSGERQQEKCGYEKNGEEKNTERFSGFLTAVCEDLVC